MTPIKLQTMSSLSQNTVQSFMRSNGSSGDDSSSIVKNKVTTTNGVCNSDKVGGNGNDKLYSSGNCNDMLRVAWALINLHVVKETIQSEDYNSKKRCYFRPNRMVKKYCRNFYLFPA